ncbi:MAG TPA: Stp1/IreP family PP2C-type Ser/Thr phosphatase [Solirubrobacteraceae bacterium]|jgi:protein phosphatase|nr:Stp1/IreP family PP2C-type Ser/Thr phosphatase [Solirubrobacteraceae bacterium]
MLRAAETIVVTDVGRQRRDNEDSSYASSPVFVVADGMGGAQAGEVASQMVVEEFSAGLPEDGSPEERLSVVIQKANQEIHARSRSDAASAGMGTTVTAAYLDEDAVVLAHVGDSRGYLLRDGELSRLTEDHSLVEELLRGGKLTEEEALEHPQRSVITRALGIEPIVEIDTWTYPLHSGDVVLLCSDGLTSMLSEQRVQEVLVEGPDLAQAGRRLIAEANAAGGRDNITVVLFRVELASDAEPVVEQPTIIAPAGSLPTTQPAHAELAPRPARHARVQGWKRPHMPAGFVAPAQRQRHFGVLGKSIALLTALLVVLCLVGGGGYLASRQLYFLGTNHQGTVVVYRGFPYSPLGIPLYETFYVSGVPASTIPADRRSVWLNHAMRDQTNAINMINELELGRIIK